MHEEHIHNVPHRSGDFFSLIPSKQAFWLGFITAIFALCTIGFIILGSKLISGNGFSIATGKSAQANAPAGSVVTQPSPEPTTIPAEAVSAVTKDDHIRGNKDAKITIVEYSDFECPFCGQFHPTMQQVMDEYGDDVRWVYRHFPLSFHPNAEPAANAAECAGAQGKFWEFADELFANQSKLSESFYKELAGQLGLNASKFESCLSSGKYLDKVRAQSQDGAAAGVTGTPGSFIIGPDDTAIPVRGALPFSSIQSAIDSLL
jgi:protein-disulfide isomerase